jgi:hypothetical protein
LAGRLHTESARFFLFLHANRLDMTVKFMTFSEWLARRDEGFLLPKRPPRKGLSRINPLPTTNAHRGRIHTKQVKKPNPFPPTIRKVAEIVPQSIIPKFGQ